MTPPRFVIYQDKRKQWRWSLKSANGKIIADSAEGYSSRDHLVRAISATVVAALTADNRKLIKIEK